MNNIYKDAYEERVVHTKNLKAIIGDALDSMIDLVMMAAQAGVEEIELRILMEGNRRVLDALDKEQKRFEEAMGQILTMTRDLSGFTTEAAHGESGETR